MLRDALVVDDEADGRDALSQLLEARGYTVRQAENGLAALELIIERVPGCMVLDLDMPVMSGWEVLASLRRAGALHAISVVVVSAAGGAPPIGVSFLRKPCAIDDLLSMLGTADPQRHGAIASPPTGQPLCFVGPGRPLGGEGRAKAMSVLHEFLTQHRAAIIERARAKVAARRVPLASSDELAHGVPAFLSQLTELLREEARPPPADAVTTTGERVHEVMGGTADEQGDAVLRVGLTVAQVVEGYGDVCQAITEHAGETNATISVDEYRTLNLCLDVVTARAVTAFSGARDRRTAAQETERLGVLAHEMRNLLSTALLSYQVLKSGGVGIDGSTGAVLGRSLRGLRDIIDRSLAEVRLAATLHNPGRVELDQFIEEMEVGAALDAKTKGLELDVPHVARGLAVHVDRPLLASAVGNLLQNAIKFTPAGGRLTLTGHRDATHILIDVEDECGGLPEGRAETMFRPFERGTEDASGLGLGLKISRDAVTANGGEIHVRNMPGKGCVFTIALPPAA